MNSATQISARPIKILMLDTQGEHFAWSTTIKGLGHHWDVLRVDAATSLIAYLKEAPYQAVVITPSPRSHADQDCLIKAMQLQPNAVRIVLPGTLGSGAQISRSLDLAHRVFSAQDSTEQIADSIEYQVRLRRLINKPKTRAFFSDIGPLPSPPQIYRELSKALQSENSDARKIGDIIQQDPALAAKVLKMVNSAFFGLKRQVCSVEQAVALLGIRMLRGLALSGHLASLYPQESGWSSFCFERMNQRSLMVGRLAQQICKDLKLNSAIQDQAFLGGLLHDIGTLFVASKDPERYRRIMTLSAEKSTHLCTVEKKMLGFFHGEVGAYLLALWNLPPQVVEAVLLHHTPQLCLDTEFKPLTAVHIADALIPALHNELGADLSTKLSKEYLQRTGTLKELSRWQMRANSLHRSVLDGE